MSISTIIRYHDTSKVRLLQEALLSLVGQTNVTVFPIIVCQRFTDNQLHELKHDIAPYDRLLDGRITIINVDAGEGDIRSTLLNHGLSSIKSRYVAILDADDVLYSHAYSTLLNALRRSSTMTIAFGGIVWADCDDVGRSPFIRKKDLQLRNGGLYDLLVDNFCPIHSFLIDTNNIKKSDLHFRDDLRILEDYEFLLRVCSSYQSTFATIMTPIGEYRRRSNDTVRAEESLRPLPGEENFLMIAREYIKTTKRKLSVTVPISDIEMLRAHWAGVPFSLSSGDLQFPDLAQIAESAALNRAAARTLLSNFLSIGIPHWPHGYVEYINYSTDRAEITGWITSNCQTEYCGYIYGISASGSLSYCTVDIERSDVSDEFGVLHAGFRLTIPDSNKDPVYIFLINNETLYFLRQLNQ